ncbi:hypothetical protein JCM11641_001244 [Rhodosporidiobolus odoratus]
MNSHVHYPLSALLDPFCPISAPSSLASSWAAACTETTSSSPSPSSPSNRASPTFSTPETPSTPCTSSFESLEYPPSPPETPRSSCKSFGNDEVDHLFSPLHQHTKPNEEQQYFDLIQHIPTAGEHRPSVKGIGARALFAPPPLRFSLSQPDPSSPSSNKLLIPLLTTKRVPFRIAAEEFCWMLSGSTDETKLAEKGVAIWEANASREFLGSRGLVENEEGDLGPIYGFQWRHAGAKYRGKECYEGEGVDQVREVVRQIKEDPEKRKKLIVSWSAADLDKMALPPCPVLIQFYVHTLPPISLFSPSPQPRLSAFVY